VFVDSVILIHWPNEFRERSLALIQVG